MSDLPGLVDRTPEYLLDRFRDAGRPEDLAALFDLVGPELFRLALHLCPDAATAEDVLQETFLAVLERAAAYEPGRPALPWLTGILRNETRMARRREGRRPDPDRAPHPSAPDDPAALAATAEERERVVAAMQALPEPYRGVALLRWRYGLEPAEIADVRGVPPGTVWSLLSRALKRLKVEMGALPALMAMALRPERGLEGVRRALLRRVAAQTGTAAAGVAAAATTGGLLMAGKAAACAAVVVLGAAGWFVFRGEEAAVPPSGGPVVSHTDTITPPPPPARPAVEPAPAVPAEAPLPPPVDLSKCDRDLDLFGVVVDGKDVPIPGARIRALSHPWRRTAPAFLPEFAITEDGPSTLSASDGTFRLRLGRDEVVDLEVGAAGRPTVLLPDCPAGERLRVVLPEGARLLVTVKDEAGAPLPGIAVHVTELGRYSDPRIDERRDTDPGGRCAFDGLPSDRVMVTARGASVSGKMLAPMLEEGKEATVEFILSPGRTLTGRVLDGATRAPVAGATVGSGSLMEWPVTTDDEGRFSMAGWPKSNERTLCARAPGFATATLVPPAEGEVEILLFPGDGFSGLVLDAAERPLAGAKIILLGAEEGPGRTQIVDFLLAETGSDGRFAFTGVRHDFSHLLMVTAPGHARLGMEVPIPDGPAGSLRDLGTLRLGPSQVMAGRVLDGHGDPVPGVEVRASPREGMGGRMPPVPERRRTDDLGRFRFPDVGPGTWRLDARFEGATPPPLEVALPPGEDRLDLLLQSPPLPGGSTDFTVRVLGPEGEPVKGIYIWANPETAGIQRETGSDGTCDFKGLPGTTARIHVNIPRTLTKAPDFLRIEPLEARLADGELLIRLVAAARIRGRVLGPDGKPLPRMLVQSKGPAGTAGDMTHTGADGEFELGVAPGGPHEISVPGFRLEEGPAMTYAPGRAPFRADPQEVTAPADGIVIPMREIRSGMTLTVRVVDAEGRGVPHISISGPSVRMGEGIPATGEDGRVVLKDLPEEESRFTPVAGGGTLGGPPVVPDGFVVPEPFMATPRGQEVVLTLRKGEALRGIVLDAEGRPAPMAWVQIQTDDFVLSQAWSGPDGRFTIWLSPGRKRQMVAAMLLEPGKGMREQAMLQGADAPQGEEIEIRTKPVPPR